MESLPFSKKGRQQGPSVLPKRSGQELKMVQDIALEMELLAHTNATEAWRNPEAGGIVSIISHDTEHTTNIVPQLLADPEINRRVERQRTLTERQGTETATIATPNQTTAQNGPMAEREPTLPLVLSGAFSSLNDLDHTLETTQTSMIGPSQQSRRHPDILPTTLLHYPFNPKKRRKIVSGQSWETLREDERRQEELQTGGPTPDEWESDPLQPGQLKYQTPNQAMETLTSQPRRSNPPPPLKQTPIHPKPKQTANKRHIWRMTSDFP